MVQFHWWDYGVPGHWEVWRWLSEMMDSGKIRYFGGTNFDTPHTEAILHTPLRLLSMQTQYSLLDNRPENGLAALCEQKGVALLCYGTVAGGFLSDRWLGQPEPEEPLENRSLTKYKLIIDDFGGWPFFQELLRACRAIADRHGTDIATVASGSVLNCPGVAAVIVGGRNAAHADANAAIASFQLTEQDRDEMGAVLAQRTGPLGDAYSLERDRAGRHGAVMKYNLNSA